MWLAGEVATATECDVTESTPTSSAVVLMVGTDVVASLMSMLLR
jgi:hypothetical protein